MLVMAPMRLVAGRRYMIVVRHRRRIEDCRAMVCVSLRVMSFVWHGLPPERFLLRETPDDRMVTPAAG